MGKIVVEKKAKKVLGDLTNEEVARLRQRSDKSLKRALHGKSILQVSKETWKSDPFSNIPVIPGVKNYKKPSIEKFLAGKTSIFSIAKSIDEEQQALNVQKRREISHKSIWIIFDLRVLPKKSCRKKVIKNYVLIDFIV